MTAGLGFEMVKVTPGVAARYYGKCVRTLARWFDRKCDRLLSSESLNRPYRSHRRYWVPKWWQNGQPLESDVSVLPETPARQEVEVKRTPYIDIDNLRYSPFEDSWLVAGFKGEQLRAYLEWERSSIWGLIFLKAVNRVMTDLKGRELAEVVIQSKDVTKGAKAIEVAIFRQMEEYQDAGSDEYYDDLVDAGLCLGDFQAIPYPEIFPQMVSDWCKNSASSLLIKGETTFNVQPLAFVISQILTPPTHFSPSYNLITPCSFT